MFHLNGKLVPILIFNKIFRLLIKKYSTFQITEQCIVFLFWDLASLSILKSTEPPWVHASVLMYIHLVVVITQSWKKISKIFGKPEECFNSRFQIQTNPTTTKKLKAYNTSVQY